MIDVEEVEKTILELENHDVTFATCEKLAWLYIVRDHQKGAFKKAPRMEGSEFLEIASQIDAEHLLRVLNEHMECIKALYPREYSAIINKLRA